MKNKILTIAIIITFTATAASLYLARITNPTDIQMELSRTANTIVVAGTNSIFGLLEDDMEKKNSDR